MSSKNKNKSAKHRPDKSHLKQNKTKQTCSVVLIRREIGREKEREGKRESEQS